MMTAWSHLPNAALIDEVLASLKAGPEKWNTVGSAVKGAAWDAARDAARNAVWDADRSAARDAAWDAAWDAAMRAGRNTSWGAAWDAAWGAIAALIAYDEAGQFMKLPVDHLRRLHRLDPHPMFLLLQPAAIAFAPQKEDRHALVEPS